MQEQIPSQLSDAELVAAVAALAVAERRTTVTLIAHLAELEARRLHLEAGFPSMFVYCVEVLRLSPGGAYNRIEAARTARAFPAVLDLLEQGRLNLASLRLLAPHLTEANHQRLLAGAAGKSKREVQALLATAFPKPDVVPSIRRVPARPVSEGSPEPSPCRESTDTEPTVGQGTGSLAIFESAGESAGGRPTGEPPNGERPTGERPNVSHSLTPMGAAPRPAPPTLPRHPLVTPLSADRYHVRFTASGTLCDKLKRAQDLLRHAVPDGDPGEIFERALTALLAELDRRKFAATDRPRASRDPAVGSRAVPAAVKRAVTVRDGGRCAFVSRSGTLCGTRAFLEFHHVVPYARGGPATVDNIQLRCRGHNGYEADLDFGSARGTGTSISVSGAAMGVSGVLSTRPGTSWPNGVAHRSPMEEEVT